MSTLSEFIIGLKWVDLPPDVQDKVKICLLDHLGAALAGFKTEDVGKAANFAKWVFGSGEPKVSLLGTGGSMGLTGAVFLNATAAAALDIDDGHRGAMGHPGAVVFPATLAAAELVGASGEEFLTAAVLGYEVALEAGRRLYAGKPRWTHATGTWACLGAAAAAARLLRLTGPQAKEAVGIAEAHSPLAPVEKVIRDGGMVKESIGWAALTGLSAALLAQEGFTGPRSDIVERGGWGMDYHIRKVYFKGYPCCRWSHPVLDAALFLQKERNIAPEDVKTVEVFTFTAALAMENSTPKTSCEAQYSIPFPVGAALTRGRFTPEELSQENLRAPDILDMARRVQLFFDQDCGRVFPAICSARVVVEKQDGSRIDAGVYRTKGDWDNPFSMAEMEEKFFGLTAGALNPDVQGAVLQLVKNLEQYSPALLLHKM